MGGTLQKKKIWAHRSSHICTKQRSYESLGVKLHNSIPFFFFVSSLPPVEQVRAKEKKKTKHLACTQFLSKAHSASSTVALPHHSNPPVRIDLSVSVCTCKTAHLQIASAVCIWVLYIVQKYWHGGTEKGTKKNEREKEGGKVRGKRSGKIVIPPIGLPSAREEIRATDENELGEKSAEQILALTMKKLQKEGIENHPWQRE